MKDMSDPGWKRALMRYDVVMYVDMLVQMGSSLSSAIKKASQKRFKSHDHDGEERRHSESSIYRWYSLFKKSGIDALFDRPHLLRGSSLSPDFLSFLKEEKTQDPEASIPEVIERARQKNVISESAGIDRTTVYRAARHLNLPIMRRRRCEATNMRPFAFEHRMMMVLCDGKVFRAGPRGLKRTALFFIDDATRYILDVFVGTSESTLFFLRSLLTIILNFGVMSRLYLDRGPGFKSHDTKKVLANIGIPLILATADYPEGRAKIERFNGTVTQDVLRGLNKPEIDPSCEALELRLRHYCRKRYNTHPHSGISNRSPEKFFLNDDRPLSFPHSEEELRRMFFVTTTPKVRRDNVVCDGGRIYEVPLGYTGCRVTIYRDVLLEKIFMLHNGEFMELQPPDLGANAREKRAKLQKNNDVGSCGPVTTAAEMHFNKEFTTIVSDDGGFSNTSTQQMEENDDA
jgi:putative transposase